MKLDLCNQRALVGGSSKGLGLASAKELSQLGAIVTLTGREESALQRALSQLDHSFGQPHDYLVIDYKKSEQLQATITQYLSDGKVVHILINNTGGPMPGKAIDISPRQYVEVFEMQLANFQYLVQAVVPGMKKAGFGRILNITGTAIKEPLPDMGLSNTIRSAVAAWAKTLAGELGGFGITINNILPGNIRTDRSAELIASSATKAGKPEKEIEQAIISAIPAGRIGHPEDFGAVVAFLCTPSAGYINGINLPVDGGKLKCL